MRRLLLVAALAIGVAAPHAQAADSVPAPTVKVTTRTSTGVELVKGQTKARWIVVTPGKLAEMHVDSVNLPQTTTTIESLWTSRPVRIYKGITAVAYSGQLQRRGAPTGASSASYGLRYRQEGKAWSPWRDVISPVPFSSEEFKVGDSLTPVQNEKVRYQFQVRFKIVIADTNKETHRWVARANN